jgi:hypothetical protein
MRLFRPKKRLHPTTARHSSGRSQPRTLIEVNIRPVGFVCIPMLALSLLLTAQDAPPKTGHFSPAAQHCQNKLDSLERNGRSNPVQRRSTQINADEMNAWFREGGYKLPQGVQKVVFHSHPDTIQANATVDFDAVKEGRRNLNPLLSMFSGVHEVEVTATASAQNGQGHVSIETVSIDGVGVPHLALELFVNKYLKPKYPNVGLENDFQMPDRIDTATVGNDNILLTQR